MSHTYNPKFHADNNITYWDQSRGWIHRVHPLNVSHKIKATWRESDQKKWNRCMELRGYVKIGKEWHYRPQKDFCNPD